jgi:hypothetical protein
MSATIEQKFCTGCQTYRPLEGGTMRKWKNGARWRCAGCTQHKTESIYKSHGKGTDPAALAKLMQDLGWR